MLKCTVIERHGLVFCKCGSTVEYILKLLIYL